MTDDGALFVQTDGLRTFSQIHADVAASLSQLLGAPGPAGVPATHGPIAAAVSAALGDVLRARQGTIQTTANTGTTLSGLLLKAAQAYDRGDQQSAGKLHSAGDAADGPGRADAGAPAGTAGAANPGGAASGAMGQVLGQLGQMGQMGQQAAGPAQGLAQPMQQVPQQVMQGVQQIVEKATQRDEAQPGETAAGRAPEQSKQDHEASPRDLLGG